MTTSMSPTIEWTRLLGANFFEYASALTTGTDGAIYMAGHTYGNLDGQTDSGSTYRSNAFLTKYNPDGTKAWTRLLGTSASDYASALTTGTGGAIYMAGYTGGNLDGQANSGGNDAFLTKYSPDPSRAWTRLLGTSSSNAKALTTDALGAIYMAGWTFGNPDGQTNSGSTDAFLTKYNADGTKVWTRLLGTTTDDRAWALTTDSAGAIYMAGYTYGNLDGQTYSGAGDAFLTKYNPDGTKVWTRLLGTSSGDYANALTTGIDGAIYMAGYTYGNLDGQTDIGSTYRSNAFLTKYSPDGTKAWTRLLGVSASDYANALTRGTDGAIYMAGYTGGNLEGETNSGGNDAFLTKYNPDGPQAWTRLLGTSSTDYAYALTTDSKGAVYMAGGTEGNLYGQTNSGNSDAFLAKYQLQVPILQFSTASGSASEGNSGSTTINVQATLSAASTQAVTVPISYSGSASSGTDYTNAATTLTIAAGQTTGGATFSVVGDTVGESNETVVLTMGATSNAALGSNTTFIHTIVNDDDTPPPTAQPTGAFLPAGTHIALASPLVNVYGASGQETVVLGAGATQVVLDQNVDRVHLGAAPTSYLFQQSGNRLIVSGPSGGAPILTATLQTDADGTVVVFPGGSASATVVAGVMLLGGATVPPLTAPTAVVPTLGATITPPTGPSTAGVFLGSGANFTAASSGLKLYGAAGNEVVTIARGTSGIEANQLIERLQFNGFSTAALGFQQQGNRLLVFDGNTLLGRTPLQTDPDGTLITTTDGTMQAKVSSARMFLGGALVSSAAPGTVVPLDVDTTLRAPTSRINVDIAAAGSYNAAAGDFTFILRALNDSYAYTVNGFGTGDRIVGPAGLSPSLTNANLGDGRVDIEYSAPGKSVTITLTGLLPAQDALLFGAADLNSAFGAGTIV